MKRIILLLTVIGFGLTLNVYSQKETLDARDFYSLIRPSTQMRFAASRRETGNEERYKDGKVIGTKITVDEYLKPDKQHFISTESKDGKVTKLEVIALGKNYYQRENGEGWKKIQNWYGSGGMMAGNPEKQEFTVETIKVNNQTVRIYTGLYLEKNEYLDKAGLSYTQIKSWVTDKGQLSKEEIVIGIVNSKEIRYKTTYQYEYNPKNLKIEAPIK